MYVNVIKENESVIYHGKIYGHGASFEVDEAIGKSLVERGYVVCIGDEAKMQTGYLDADQLGEMSYPDLKRLAAQMGLDATGKKDELIARICGVEIFYEEETNAEDNDVDTEAEDSDADADVEDSELPQTSMPE